MDISRYFPPVHPAGWPFIAGFAALAFLLAVLGGPCWGVAGFVLLGWCFFFFRNPARVTPVAPGLVVSPADGLVIAVREVVPDPSLGLGGEKHVRISIFLDVFDVHVNRSPVDGTVVAAEYRPGKFLNASLDKASEDNERMALVLEMTGDHPAAGRRVGVVQIAGLVARRILCDAKKGDALKAGQRYGIIRFGSRADIYLPEGLAPLVVEGQTAIGGETLLADAGAGGGARKGEVR